MTILRTFKMPISLVKRLSSLANATQCSEDFHVKEALKYYFENYADVRIAKDRFNNPSSKVISKKRLRSSLGLRG